MSLGECLVIVVVAFLVLGPERLVGLPRIWGRWFGRLLKGYHQLEQHLALEKRRMKATWYDDNGSE